MSSFIGGKSGTKNLGLVEDKKKRDMSYSNLYLTEHAGQAIMCEHVYFIKFFVLIRFDTIFVTSICSRWISPDGTIHFHIDFTKIQIKLQLVMVLKQLPHLVQNVFCLCRVAFTTMRSGMHFIGFFKVLCLLSIVIDKAIE